MRSACGVDLAGVKFVPIHWLARGIALLADLHGKT